MFEKKKFERLNVRLFERFKREASNFFSDAKHSNPSNISNGEASNSAAFYSRLYLFPLMSDFLRYSMNRFILTLTISSLLLSNSNSSSEIYF